MRIHYFQRYHSKENVVTSNTMLMLSRLYNYNPDKFFSMLNELLFKEAQAPELTFELQSSGKESVPDAIISQPSFKIIVETKLYNQYNESQLLKHIENFKNEDFKVLLTLDPKPMKPELKEKVDAKIKNTDSSIKHVNTTFADLIDAMEDIIDENDFEIVNVLDDFKQYCIDENLVGNVEKWMRAVLTGTSFDLNIKYNIYYCTSDRNTEFGYLALYKEKAIRAIGKVLDIVTGTYDGSNFSFKSKNGLPITDDLKAKLLEVIAEADRIGHDLKYTEHNFFVVDNFYRTYFFKSTKNPIVGTKNFDLFSALNINKLPETEDIANALDNKSWESVNY